MPSSQIERKLAAIMFTDIAGYTALSAKDENKALALLDTQKQILTPIIEEFNGTLHKEIGDGLLFTFPTVTEAVNCGIKIQEKTKDNDDLNLRIGIHEGEITLKDGDALGDDVNVASRIEAFSPCGGIAISSKVQQNISSLPEFETSYIGRPELKGVSQEVKVYCITSHGLPKADEIDEPTIIESKSNFNIFALTGGILTAIGIAFWIAVGVFDVSFGGKTEVPSIAILMMENLGNEDEEFWSSSMTADLITKVEGAGLINVASLQDIRNIDKNLTIEEIAKKLRVKYILSHSFQIKDDGFDLWCKLENTENGVALFSNKISEPMDMATQMVGKLANDIITSLKIKTKQNLIQPLTNNVDAYQYYLRAKYLYDENIKYEVNQNTKISRELLQKAIKLDENLFEAKIFLMRTYYLEHYYELQKRWNLSTDYINEIHLNMVKDILEQAKKAGNKLWEGRALRHFGNYYGLIRDIDKQEYYYEQALIIADEIGDAQGMLKILRNIGGDYFKRDKYEIALNYYFRALEICETLGEKKEIAISLREIGNLFYSLNEHDKTLDYLTRSLLIFKQIGDKYYIGEVHANIGNMYGKKGDYDKALDFFNRSITNFNENGDKRKMAHVFRNMGEIYADKGDLDTALDYFDRSLKIYEEIGDKYGKGISLGNIGFVYGNKGDYDTALDYYGRSVAIAEELGDKKGKGLGLGNIGLVYDKKGDYDTALGYYNREFKINEELGNKDLMRSSLLTIGWAYYTIGEYNKALDYYNREFKINEELGNKYFISNHFANMGLVYIQQEDYNKAVEYLEKSATMQMELDSTIALETLSHLFLSKKILGKEYNVTKIHTLIKEQEKIDDYINFALFKLLDDPSYLEAAYNQVQEKASAMEDEVKAKFLSYPIPAAIVEEWEKVTTDKN